MRPEEYGRAGRCSRGRAPSTTSVFLFNHEGVFSKFPQVPRFPTVQYIGLRVPLPWTRMRRIRARRASTRRPWTRNYLHEPTGRKKQQQLQWRRRRRQQHHVKWRRCQLHRERRGGTAGAPAPPAPSGGIWVSHRGDLPWSPTASPKSSPNLMRKSSSSSAGQFVPSPVAARRAIERARSFSTR